MSGRKQHFIPQSLLKGFGRRGKGEKVQVVVYTYERGIFLAATDGVAAEREFYSKLAVDDEEETLDDKITEFEPSIADTLAKLRDLGDGEAADVASAAKFVTHLVVRNDHLRNVMTSAGTALFGGFAEVMSDENQAKGLLGLAGDKPSAMFTEQMDKTFAEFGAVIAKLGMSREQFAEWAFEHSKANFAEFHAEMIGPLQRVFSESTGKVAEITADAHRRSLGQSITPEAWVTKLGTWKWCIAQVDDPLILPDCVAVAFNRKGEAFPLMLADFDEAEAIYVPVGSHRLLVGSGEPSEIIDDLNDVLASCSWDFFVGSERVPEFEALLEKIRSRTGSFVSESVSDILSETVRKLTDESA